ncbi:DUF1214 domain-containing protein [Cupriavidus basilensis]
MAAPAAELAFAADALPQVGAFWSLTMYDKTDCMLVDNALGRYSLGDRSPSLRYDADAQPAAAPVGVAAGRFQRGPNHAGARGPVLS